jgi:hypothetical protein
MNHQDRPSRFLSSLQAAFRELLDRHVVSPSLDEGDGERIARFESTNSTGVRVELRTTGAVAELFLDDLEPVELDENSSKDLEEFDSFARALASGDVRLVRMRTWRGWRPKAIEWPGGIWYLPGNPGVIALVSKDRRERMRRYL